MYGETAAYTCRAVLSDQSLKLAEVERTVHEGRTGEMLMPTDSVFVISKSHVPKNGSMCLGTMGILWSVSISQVRSPGNLLNSWRTGASVYMTAIEILSASTIMTERQTGSALKKMFLDREEG